MSYLLLASIVTGSEDGIIMCKNWYSITFRAVATCRSKECISFLSIAPEFAKDTIKELKESGELNQEWLKESIGELTIKRGSKKTLHVATLQTEILAHIISKKWSNLTENIDYQYKYFIPEWLYLASAE